MNTENSFRLSSATRLGYVHLTVKDLERQLSFYRQVLGFHLHWRAGGEAALGTAEEILLRLSEDPDARRYPQAAGMYHFAVLYPDKKELARAIARLFALRYPNYPTDHGVSKTTYLDDLEGNNIELYIRTLDDAVFEMQNGQIGVRYADGRQGTGRDPLDVESLFRELGPEDRLDELLPAGTRIGHVHLYATGLEATMDFYSGLLGFEKGPVFESFRMGEVGLDAQQPHVVAFNTWKGEGIPPAPAGALGMQYFSVILPDSDELLRIVIRLKGAGYAVDESFPGYLLRDPSGIGVLLGDRMPALHPENAAS